MSAAAPGPAPTSAGNPPETAPEKAPAKTRGLTVVIVVVLVLLALGVGRTLYARKETAKTLDVSVGEQAVTYVRTTRAKAASNGQRVQLPGTLQGAQQATVSSRAAGYVKSWKKDIGSAVKQGELLAEIESPEVEQQISQAVAARAQVAASLGLAKSTVERWEALRKRDVASQQELDEKRSAAAQAEANVAAADANVQRLRQLQGFTRVTAPFAGVVTRRNVDVGDLIESGGRALFTVTQMDPLRVYVNVPQAYAQLVKAGQPVTVTQSELRDKRFAGTVARTAAAIDAATRSMQVEIALRNEGGALIPGAYVQVELPLPANATLTVPTNVLLFRADGTRVAVVDGAGKVHLRAVVLGRNLGEAVEVQSGVTAEDRLIVNPADSLAEGDTVTVRDQPEGAASAPGAGIRAAP